MPEFIRSNAYPWALTGIFAAVQLVLTVFPFSFAIGGGGFLTLGLVGAPIIGFLLGPFFGTVSVVIGSFLGVMINVAAHPLAWFTPIAPAAGALVAGSLRVRKAIVAPILFIVGIAAFLASPIALLALTFLWFHVIALVLAILFMIPPLKSKLAEGLELSPDVGPAWGVLSIWMLCLIAVLADQLIGSAIGAFYFLTVGLDVPTLAGIYTAVLLIYPIERVLASVIAAIILVAVARFLAKTYFDLPTVPGGTRIQELTEAEIEQD